MVVHSRAKICRLPIRRHGGGYAVLLHHPEKHFTLPTAIQTPSMGRRVLTLKATEISARLIAAMEHRGIDIAALAKASGKPHRTLAKRIHEGTYAGKELLATLAPVLGVPLAWLDAGTAPLPVWYRGSHSMPGAHGVNEIRAIGVVSGTQPIRRETADERRIAQFLDWQNRFAKRWHSFIRNQSDPRDSQVTAATREWTGYHRSVVGDIQEHLNLSQLAALSTALRLSAPDAKERDAGEELLQARQRAYEMAIFNAVEAETNDQETITLWPTGDPDGSVGICQNALERLAKRRKRSDGLSENDLVTVRFHLGKIPSEQSLAALATVKELPPTTFSLCFEALIRRRDDHVDKKENWSAVGTALRTLFQLILPNDTTIPLMDAVRLHRRQVTGKAKVPIRSAADVSQRHRLFNLHRTYGGRIVLIAEVESLYQQRGLDTERAIQDLEILASGPRGQVVFPLRNDYIRFLDVPDPMRT